MDHEGYLGALGAYLLHGEDQGDTSRKTEEKKDGDAEKDQR